MRMRRHSPYRPPRAPRRAIATSAGRSLLLAGWLVAASAFYVTDVLADRLIDAPTSTTAEVSVVLTDDDQGAGLFDADRLAPGPAGSNCVRVSYLGGGAASVRLFGRSGGTGLDRSLHLTVEAGTGGAFGDCTGFSGTELYDGLLQDFTQAHADFPSGLVGVSPSSSQPTTTYRFSVWLLDDPGAQGRTASATLIWEARAAAPGDTGQPGTPSTPQPTPPSTGPEPTPPGPAPVTSPPGPEPVTDERGPSLPPAPDPGSGEAGEASGAGPQPVTGQAGDATGSGSDPVTGEAGGATGDAPQPVTDEAGDAPASEPRLVTDGPGRAGDPPSVTPRSGEVDSPSLWGRTLRLVKALADESAFPLILLVIMVIFLVVQDSIDRRDPKLALAPVYPEPDLPFEPLPQAVRP
ncbi:MAG TPA: hypothetical protein VHF25_12855 [Nitriliruptorales bacterium]|nr:hypothetical protein [Nitriliruptorales bacterium]